MLAQKLAYTTLKKISDQGIYLIYTMLALFCVV